MKTLVAAALVTLCLSSAAFAQNPSRKETTITTTGVGEARRDPDYTEVLFTARGEGADAMASLRALAALQAKLETALKADASVVRFNTTNLQTQEVRGKDCDRYSEATLNKGDCAILGAVSTLAYRVRVSPASRGGAVAPLMAQLGAVNTRLGERGINSETGLADQALAIAFADAKRQAQATAKAAGMKLGPILKIAPQGQADNGMDEVVVTGARAPAPSPVPPVSIGVNLEQVSKEARLTVTFALEP